MCFWFFMTICNLILPVLMIVLGKDDDFIGVLGAVVISVECIIMFISIFFTERALAKKFD